ENCGHEDRARMAGDGGVVEIENMGGDGEMQRVLVGAKAGRGEGIAPACEARYFAHAPCGGHVPACKKDRDAIDEAGSRNDQGAFRQDFRLYFRDETGVRGGQAKGFMNLVLLHNQTYKSSYQQYCEYVSPEIARF